MKTQKYTTSAHQFRTIILSFAMVLICTAVAWLSGGLGFVFETLFFILLLLFLSPYISPKIVLSMHKAEEIDEFQAPVLYKLVSELTLRNNLNIQPKVYYIDSPKYIAFTSGGKKVPVIALSDGLLQKLNRRELNAVIAHEMAHIKNQDIRTMALAEMTTLMVIATTILTLVSVIINTVFTIFSDSSVTFFPIILLCIASVIIFRLRMRLSHEREYEADRIAAEISEDPEALISALNKLSNLRWRWIENLFYLRENNPIPAELRTHPETENRILKLREFISIHQKSRSFFENSPMELIMPKHLREVRNRHFINNN